MEVAELRRIHRLPKAQQSIVHLHPPMSHLLGLIAYVASHWLALNFLKEVLIFLEEDHSARDVLLDTQSLGPGCTEDWNGKQERRRRLVLNRFRIVLIWWSKMTFGFLRTMEDAVEVFFCSDGSYSREVTMTH